MKIIISRIVVLAVLGLESATVFSIPFVKDGIYYEIDASNNAFVTFDPSGSKYNETFYSIPAMVKNSEGTEYRVTAIGKKAFYGSPQLVKIVLPESLEAIEESAFYNCDRLTLITVQNGDQNTSKLPDAVKTIGNNAFSLCSNLTKLQLSASLTSIGRSVFSYCGIESVTIPASVTKIDKSAFANCENLSSMIVESGNTIYDSRNSCNAIIRTHDKCLVFGCKTTIIPNDIIAIGENAFYGSDFGLGLGRITLPSSLTTISSSAFYSCKISSIVIPDAVESIGDNAFSLCSNLEKIGFSSLSSLLSIGRSAFSYCEKLDNVIIPKSVLSIGKNAFANCENLSRIQVESGNAFYSSPNDCNAILQGGKLIVGCSGTDISNSGAVSIGEGAFYGSRYGGDIVIPSSIKTIEEQGFYSCDKLTSVSIEDGLTTIGRYAFSLCSKLKKVQLPSSLKNIDKYAFHYCDNLREITSLIQEPFAIDNSVFDGLFITAKLRVPTGTKATYQQTSGWNFSTIEEFDPSGIDSPTIAALRIYSYNGVLYIESATNGNCSIYTVSGQLMRKVALKQGVNTIEGLSKGIYIVNGQKIMVK